LRELGWISDLRFPIPDWFGYISLMPNRRRFGLAGFLAVQYLLSAGGGALLAQAPQDPAPNPPPPQPRFAQQVDVVAVTPIHGIGLPRLLVPANVQVFSIADLETPVQLDLASLLDMKAASVHRTDAQGGAFQPDIQFRGFTASPLLGASEGLAVYQDGVRINEAFGDTVNWDALPASAIAGVNVIPGSNPLFGLNALGGAMSIRTKDGFAFPGARASIAAGSFGRVQLDAEAGGHRGPLAWFAAGSLVDERGWRDVSPSTIRRFFGALTHRRNASTINLTATLASNDLTGNGAAPSTLLEVDRSAVFTHPDRTDDDLALVALTFQTPVFRTGVLDVVAYYRRSSIGTFNGDAADDDDDREAEEEADDDHDDAEAFDGVNNMSRTRGRTGGATVQISRASTLLGRPNHFVAGGGFDASSVGFDFAAEWAYLTDTRGTAGTGLFDDDALVDLGSRSLTTGAYATSTWSLADAFGVTASARANWTSVALRDRIGTALTGDHRFGRLNASAGVTYRIAGPLSAYASYSQSSRVPTPVELTCADPDDPCRLPNAFVSDPPLEQVVAGTWEGGVRGASGGASWSVTAFATAVNDDVIFVSSGTLRGEGHFENVDRTRRRGLEVTAAYSAANRVALSAAYTWQQAAFDSDLAIASMFHPEAIDAEIQVRPGDRLPAVPTHIAKLGFDAAVTQRLRVGASIRAHSSQLLRGDEANRLDPVAGYAVVDLQARQRLATRLAVVARVDNLFDARYHTFGVLGEADLLGEAFDDDVRFYSPGAPRAAWVGMEVRF
jgi:outer membrane receptor protein involved in Fe transport